MKIPSPARLLMFAALAVLLLAAGCAKKPVVEQPGTETAASQTTEMSSQDVSGIGQQGMTEEGVSEGEAAPTVAAVTGLERIFYDFDQYTLNPQARETLAANAAYMQAHPDVQVRIEGHCDERGSDEYNLALGERRAMAAMNYLVSLGIDKDRLSTISYGEEMPLDPSHTEEAWAKNRRAEFKVMR